MTGRSFENSIKKSGVLLFSFLLMFTLQTPMTAWAADFYCEVMTIKGTAKTHDPSGHSRVLKEGDLLKEGDTVIVPKGSQVSLGFDKEWKNVTLIQEDSKVEILSVHPTGLRLEKGDLIVKLDRLPNGSSFELQTPVALAAVRGSLFQVSHRNGGTITTNFDESQVYLFSLDLDGIIIPSPLILLLNQKGQVPGINQSPAGPLSLSADELKQLDEILADLEETISRLLKVERWAKLKTIQEISQILRSKGKSGPLSSIDKAKQISEKIVRHNLERANRNSDRKSQRKLRRDPIGGSGNGNGGEE